MTNEHLDEMEKINQELGLYDTEYNPLIKRDIHPEITRFANVMQYKLDKNKHKDKSGDQWPRDERGARNGWDGCDMRYLIEKLHEEVGELMVALYDGNSKEEVMLEAADVANIAMMIQDNFGKIHD